MKKKICEIKTDLITTVEDYINVLLTVPKDYDLSPLGTQVFCGIDNYNKCLYLDEPNYVEYCEGNIREMINDNGDIELITVEKDSDNIDFEDSWYINVEESELETYSIYVLIGEVQQDNDSTENVLFGIFSSREKAEESGNNLISQGTIVLYEVIATKINETCE